MAGKLSTLPPGESASQGRRGQFGLPKTTSINRKTPPPGRYRVRPPRREVKFRGANIFISPTLIIVGVIASSIAFAASESLAQNSSLLYQGPPANAYQIPAYGGQAGGNPPVPLRRDEGGANEPPPITLAGASWTYQVPPPLRVFQLNDVVTIRVDEITRVLAEGSAESRKRTLFEAILSDWIRITDFRLRPDPQANGDPAVSGESNQQYRAESTVESRESMAFNIAATVVDIRPNGSLVLEARKAIRVNDNLWETSLSGLCRAADIAPDNVVLSKDLIDLEIRKMDRGHLRDGYKRGWFSRWLDRVQPF
jgi:flagellar L-ring protein precursor FlgH